MKARAFEIRDADAWDAFVARAVQGVFLHTRRFLGYHGERFTDRSLIVENPDGRIVALFPAAEMPGDPVRVCSHPGTTYGGILHEAHRRPEEVQQAISLINEWYRAAGYRSLSYKSVPHHIRRSLSEADSYALWKDGAVVSQRDLWNVLDLQSVRRTSKGHRWSIREASRSGLSVSAETSEAYESFHRMLEESLLSRHNVQPVHSAAELVDIQDRFPDVVELWGCRAANRDLIAGVWLFKLHSRCWHTQYIASSRMGRESNAAHLLLEKIIELAREAGVCFFSFGASTSAGGRVLNASLQQFKAGFGAGTVVHEIYEMTL